MSTDLIDVTISRGRQRELDRCDSGQATFTLENEAWQYVPGYSSGANYPNVLPRRWIRLSVTVSGTTYRLFTGLINRWEVQWHDPGYSTVTVQATDALAFLNNVPLQGQLVNETTGNRITDILTKVGWNGPTSIAAGTKPLPVKTFVWSDNQSAGATLNETADSEPGTLFVAGDGTITYSASFAGTGGMPAALGDRPDLGEIDFDDGMLSLADDTLYNDIRGTRDGGSAEQRSIDSGSNTEFGPSMTQKQTYNINDTDLAAVCSSFLSRYKYPTQLFDPVNVTPTGNLNNAFAWCCQAEIAKTVTINRTPPPALSLPRFSQACVINYLTHTLKPGAGGGEWSTQLRLAGAALH